MTASKLVAAKARKRRRTLTHQGQVRGRVALKNKADSEHNDLLQTLAAIKTEWRQRKRSALTAPPYDRASSYLKREVYRLVRELVTKTNEAEVIAKLGALGARPRPTQSAFHAMIDTLLPDDDLARTEKHRYAAELQYARIHRVPDEYLVGFIFQVGSARIKGLLSAGSREPWFKPPASSV